MRDLIAPKMKNLTTFLDNNWKYAFYIGGDINWIYCYLDIIGAPTILTTSGQHYHHTSPSSSINNDTTSIQTVIAVLCTIHKRICEWCGRIGHKSDACIICGPKLLPPTIRRKMNKFDELHGNEINEPPRDWNIQTPADHFKYRTSPYQTNPVV